VIVVSLTVQFLLYWQPFHLAWLTPRWGTISLPRVVLIGALLTSVVPGTYHPPVRQQLIVMFLDIARSTALPKRWSFGCTTSSRVFFFDIDEPISDHGGAVRLCRRRGHPPLAASADPTRNAFSVLCLFVIERKMLASRPTIVASLRSRRPSGLGCTPVP
jgi:hypothetical protein